MASADVGDQASVTKLLRPILTESADLGFLGPMPLKEHINHALRLAIVVRDCLVEGGRLLDLGSGGGVPGLVIAAALPEVPVTLLESQHKRCEFLRRCVQRLDGAASIEVVEGRAEVLSRTTALEGQFSVVVARSFGAPAVVAECATRFLTASGRLVVSEPPVRDVGRWSSDGLALLGLGIDRIEEAPIPVAVLQRVASVNDRYPRRDGVPGRKPLW